MTKPINWILWFLIGLHATVAITVSPDVGLRNQSQIEVFQAEVPPTDENDDALQVTEKSERVRRLIPYTTFYVPPGFPIQEFYNLNPIVFTPENLKPQPVPEEPKQVQVKQQQVVNEQHSTTQTSSPAYYEEITRKPISESSEELTPQEKYVAFLQQQIQRQTQQLKLRNQEKAYADSLNAQQPNTSENQRPSKPITEVPSTYTESVTPGSTTEEFYSQSPHQSVQTAKPAPVNQPNELRPNYYEYLQQNQQQIVNIPGPIQPSQPYNEYNPVIYYTTPNPSYISSVPSVYREPDIEPLYEADPVFKIPVKKPPPPTHQHHTETSKNFAPILTTYHPEQQITTPKPRYATFVAPPRSHKKKNQRIHPTPSPAEIESTHANAVRFPDEGPPEPPRPVIIERPRPQQETFSPPQEDIFHYPELRPESRPNPAHLQRPQLQDFEPEYEYPPELVEIPRSKFPPKPRPEMILKLRPQLSPGPEYRPNLRPSSSYLVQPESRPIFGLKLRPQPQNRPYAEYQSGQRDSAPSPPRPKPDHVTRLQPQRGDILKSHLNVKINHDLLAPQNQYNPNILEVAHPDSEKNFGEIPRPDLRPQTVLKEQPDSSVFIQQQPQERPQEQPQYEPKPIDSDVIYGHRPESHQVPELEQPRPVYVPEPEIKPQPEEIVEPAGHDSKPESSHPVSSPAPIHEDEHSNLEVEDDDSSENSLAQLLKKLQDTNQLPKTLTPDNIDNSIRTLIKILNNLKETQTVNVDPPQNQEEEHEYQQEIELPKVAPPKNRKPGPSSGRPGIDYPIHTDIPQTDFNCKEQRYKGFFGDPETGCQVWHYCDLNGGQASFLCPNGTIFSQVALTCDWWFNVKCSTTAQLYVLNERLYKYILPFTPKFPEDYSGPLVDKYLAIKFQEMEEKMRRERMKDKKDESEVKNSTPTNSTQPIETEEEEEESSEEDEDVELGGKSSIDTYSTTQQSPTTEITSNAISSISVSPTKATYESRVLSPASPRGFTAPASSEEDIGGNSSSSSKITVESEKAEVIEIRAHGNSGQLSHSHTYVAEDD